MKEEEEEEGVCKLWLSVEGWENETRFSRWEQQQQQQQTMMIQFDFGIQEKHEFEMERDFDNFVKWRFCILQNVIFFKLAYSHSYS